MISVRTPSARHLAALGALAIGVLLLLVLPAMASADPAAPASSPAAQEEAPAASATDPAPPPAATTEAAQETTEPAPAPATTEPEPSAPAPAPATVEPESAPSLSSGLPAPPEAPAEAAPAETTRFWPAETTLFLPAPPSSLGSLRAAAAADKILDAAPTAPPAALVDAPTAPPDAPARLGAAASDPRPASDVLARKLPPPNSGLVETLGGQQRSRPHALAVADHSGPGPAGEIATGPGENPFDSIAAPGGPAPVGSSLLAVLASYVLPGGGLPTATLLILVQLAVVLAAFYAPRSGFSERIHALGRLGPRFGYRTVLARPG